MPLGRGLAAPSATGPASLPRVPSSGAAAASCCCVSSSLHVLRKGQDGVSRSLGTPVVAARRAPAGAGAATAFASVASLPPAARLGERPGARHRSVVRRRGRRRGYADEARSMLGLRPDRSWTVPCRAKPDHTTSTIKPSKWLGCGQCCATKRPLRETASIHSLATRPRQLNWSKLLECRLHRATNWPLRAT